MFINIFTNSLVTIFYLFIFNITIYILIKHRLIFCVIVNILNNINNISSNRF